MVEGVKLDGVGGLAPQSRSTTRSSAEPFVIANAVTASAARPAPATVPAIGMESMLMLQAIGDGAERDRAARMRGAAMIAAMSDLQRAMLADGDPSLALRSLSELAVDGPLADDPGLAAVLRTVVLRARIEVARGERHSQ